MTRNFGTNFVLAASVLTCIFATGNLEAIAQMPPPGPPPPLPKEYQPAEPPVQPTIPSTASISPAKRKLIIEYLDCTEAPVSLSSMARYGPNQEQMEKFLKAVPMPGPKLPSAVRKDIIDRAVAEAPLTATRISSLMDSRINNDNSRREVDIYLCDKYFSEADLEQLLAFYNSPVGKKLQSVREPMTNEKMKWLSPGYHNMSADSILQWLQERLLFEKAAPTTQPK